MEFDWSKLVVFGTGMFGFLFTFNSLALVHELPFCKRGSGRLVPSSPWEPALFSNNLSSLHPYGHDQFLDRASQQAQIEL
jgi:hypothetical protein